MARAPRGQSDVAVGSDAETTTSSASPRTQRAATWWAFEWSAVIAVALILAIGVRTYVIQTFYIPSGSMEPTLNIGDRILVFKLAYDFASPGTGDVIVFKAPPKEKCGEAVTDLVKRIVGLPGQRISSTGNTIYVNSHPLTQDWPHISDLLTSITPQVVPPNQYFVMGDNHPNSCDSRVWGDVPRSDIIGKVVLKIWPLSQFGTV